MREFLVNGSANKESVTILKELKEGYNVKITRYRMIGRQSAKNSCPNSFWKVV
jgi:hypothetical protein